jgi:hypothetical protein
VRYRALITGQVHWNLAWNEFVGKFNGPGSPGVILPNKSKTEILKIYSPQIYLMGDLSCFIFSRVTFRANSRSVLRIRVRGLEPLEIHLTREKKCVLQVRGCLILG